MTSKDSELQPGDTWGEALKALNKLVDERAYLNQEVYSLARDLTAVISGWPEYQKAIFEKYEAGGDFRDGVFFVRDGQRWFVDRSGRLREKETTVIIVGIDPAEKPFPKRYDEYALKWRAHEMDFYFRINYVGSEAIGGSPALEYKDVSNSDRYVKNGINFNEPLDGRRALVPAQKFIAGLLLRG